MIDGRDGTILVVEDDPGVARLQQRRLERAGYRVVCAENADEALRQIQQGGVELILLDYRLPNNVNGLDFYAQLKATGYDLPVILVTGFSDDATVIQALRAGVRDFVTKSAEYLDYLPEAAQRVLKQVRTEHQLAATEEQIREQAALLDKANDAIIVRDLDDRIRYWNKSAERLYGWTAAEAVGQQAEELLCKELSPELEKAHQALVEKGEWTGELHQVTREGKGLIVATRWTLVRDEEGRPRYKLVINTDITEKKRLETQYLRAQRLESIGRLAGGIAHDLNNVLGQFLMALECLKEEALPPDDRLALVGDLQTNARRGADIVKQVLSFASGVEGQRVVFQPRHVIRDIEKMLRHTLPRSIEIEALLPSDLWTVQGDATQLYQVVMNLCVNALDAMPQGGRLTIVAQNTVLDEHYAAMNIEARPGPFVMIRVGDTGVGIPPDVLDKVFEPFFTTKGPGKGTGLGLSTVLGIVKSHAGFINVYSEVGKGTEFTVYLPAAEGKHAAPVEEKRALPVGRGELILVVDDEGSFRQITKATLEMFGYRVLTANDGAEAVALYAQQGKEIRAVLTDMMMPIMDGTATIRALRKLNPQVRIIAASGLAGNGDGAAAAGLGVRAFLQKPYTAEALLKALRQVLEENQLIVLPLWQFRGVRLSAALTGFHRLFENGESPHGR